MRSLLFALITGINLAAASQNPVNISTIQKIPYRPQVHVNGIRQQERISIVELHRYGLKVIPDDTSFSVIQFDIVYDCHSRALFDFSVKRYYGNTLPSTDNYLQKRVWVGDVIDVVNVVIQRREERYVMKESSYFITN